ncbi:hypothetical protein AB0L57_30105 [Nocardia sp. NPDC052254]|uniref:hypothetical protein n=1 Tax=Nocardia sp. NPDC052254 TaxID=3155681 RepID=UPI00341AF28F
MAKIHRMLIPDMKADGYDHRYDYYKKAGEYAQETLNFLDKIYQSCGEKSKVKPPTVKEAPQLPESASKLKVHGDASQTMKNYGVIALALNQAILDMQETDKGLAPIAIKTADVSSKVLDTLDQVVDAVNEQAPTVPDDGISETEYILAYMQEAMTAGEKALKKAKNDNGESASKVKDLTDQHKKDEARIKKLEQQVKDLQAGKGTGADPGTVTGSPYDPTALTPSDPSADPTGLDDLGLGDLGLDDLGTDGADTTGTDDLGNSLGDTGSTDSASDPTGVGDGYGSTPSSVTDATPASMSTPASAMGGSGMGDMMSQMLPMLAQQQMMRQMQDQDMNNRRGQLQAAYPQQPLTSAQPVNATPQPANATPASTESGPPQGSSSSQQGHPDGPAAPAARAPGADGMVEYPFPDGRTQKVSVVVAQALDAAFGNKSATDAKKAYEKTSVTWSTPKQIGEHVAPEDEQGMITGVVGVWEKVTAVVAKFGTAESGGSIEAIIDGDLHVLDGDNMDSLSGKAGEFGPFSDFQRPAGIDAAPDASGDSAPGTPIPGDQSGGVLSAAVGTPT